jgi:hypothetical protein
MSLVYIRYLFCSILFLEVKTIVCGGWCGPNCQSFFSIDYVLLCLPPRCREYQMYLCITRADATSALRCAWYLLHFIFLYCWKTSWWVYSSQLAQTTPRAVPQFESADQRWITLASRDQVEIHQVLNIFLLFFFRCNWKEEWKISPVNTQLSHGFYLFAITCFFSFNVHLVQTSHNSEP